MEKTNMTEQGYSHFAFTVAFYARLMQCLCTASVHIESVTGFNICRCRRWRRSHEKGRHMRNIKIEKLLTRLDVHIGTTGLHW